MFSVCLASCYHRITIFSISYGRILIQYPILNVSESVSARTVVPLFAGKYLCITNGNSLFHGDCLLF